jgi:hypothetical protein
MHRAQQPFRTAIAGIEAHSPEQAVAVYQTGKEMGPVGCHGSTAVFGPGSFCIYVPCRDHMRLLMRWDEIGRDGTADAHPQDHRTLRALLVVRGVNDIPALGQTLRRTGTGGPGFVGPVSPLTCATMSLWWYLNYAVRGKLDAPMSLQHGWALI